MKTGTKILCSLVIVILLCGCYIIGTRNKLVQQEQEAKQAFADVQKNLQRRNDLIPNLVNSVKGYAKHEEAVFNAITEARQNMINAKTPEETVQADAALSSALGRLLALAVSEDNPELKANENFLSLQDELAGTENRIAVARKDANEKVTAYNTSIKLFPKNIVAKMFGFKELPLFEADSGAKTAPTVSFD
ncbi:MAG: LemA family protein [Oscillospiraceae bacterium]|nr:LemA family protein [Oscillospiraceae bacterium]